MFLKSISLTNILSFGDQTTHIELRPLNILIGHNGSGKSNLIECVGLLKAIPDDIDKGFNRAGGRHDFIWKGKEASFAGIEIVCTLDQELPWELPIKYRIHFEESFFGFCLNEELIESTDSQKTFFRTTPKETIILLKDKIEKIDYTTWQLDPNESILSQLKDKFNYSTITDLGHNLKSIQIYRDWAIGRNTPLRLPQRSDMPNNFLLEDCSNLGLILSKLRVNPEAKRKVIENLRNLYPSAEDFEVLVEANSVQVFIQEGNFSIPATRLSDGTLRFLCLLAILCHPNPPPLICIEEPELGLHPDMMPVIADLLRDASTRTQLIVTTHSDLLVEQFSDEPESILTFEKRGDQSTVQRLDADELKHWLEKYSLGQLRQQGYIAGNRW